jgi:hypothetical protein
VTYIRPLMRDPQSGLYAKPENRDDELRMVNDGWVHHPPPDPNAAARGMPDDEDLTGTPLVW